MDQVKGFVHHIAKSISAKAHFVMAAGGGGLAFSGIACIPAATTVAAAATTTSLAAMGLVGISTYFAHITKDYASSILENQQKKYQRIGSALLLSLPLACGGVLGYWAHKPVAAPNSNPVNNTYSVQGAHL